MDSIYSAVVVDLRNTHLMTEFLESCDWDVDVMNKYLDIIQNCLNLTIFPKTVKKYKSFEEYLDGTIVDLLQRNGVPPVQSQIIKRVIFNRKSEFMKIMNFEEI